MWNLLSIVREMFKRNDANAVQLLEILTEEVLAIDQILIWWFNTKISASHTSNGTHTLRGGGGQNSSSSSSQHAASSLCDEIVALWRLCALNPAFSPMQRDDLQARFKDWHMHTIDKVRKARGTQVAGSNNAIKKTDIEVFTGFKASIEATQMDWTDYMIPGITYIERHRPYSKYFNLGLSRLLYDSDRGGKRTKMASGQVSSTQVMKDMGLLKEISQAQQRRRQVSIPIHKPSFPVNEPPAKPSTPPEVAAANQDAAYSSSSEGFCESDPRQDSMVKMDSDSEGESKSKGASPLVKEASQSSGEGTSQSVDSQQPPIAMDPDAALLLGAIAGKGALGGAEDEAAANAEQNDGNVSGDEYQVCTCFECD
jgi:hypothetical protein